MFSVLVIRLRSLRLLRVSGIVMRLRMFLLLITFLKASHSFRNRRSEERFSRNAETDLVCRLLLEKKKNLAATPSREASTSSLDTPTEVRQLSHSALAATIGHASTTHRQHTSASRR